MDYPGAQGYWVCTAVAVLSFILLLASGKPLLGTTILFFYYLGGVGVRERSRYAASVVFFMYVLDTLASPGVLRVLISALLLSNLRATWIAATWKPESEEAALPPRFDDTWTDKLADQFPMWLWPKLRIVYYVFSAGFLLRVMLGIVMMLARFYKLTS